MTGDFKAQKTMVESVDAKIIDLIQNCETAQAMWNKLNSYFEQQTETNVHLLQEKFFKMNLAENEDIITFIGKVEDIGKRLGRLGVEVPDSMLITKILMNLPNKYKHFISAWESTPAEQKTLVNLGNRLATEEVRNKSEESEVALISKGASSHDKDKPKYEQSQRVCYWCKKSGHIKPNCRFYNRFLANNKNNKNGASMGKNCANPSKNNSSTNNKGSALVLNTDMIKDNDGWFLDSGASNHMTFRREWFSEFEELSKTVPVRLGDSSIVMGIGKGKINVITYTKTGEKNCYLDDVLFVPELTMNLLSLSATLDKGYDIHSNKDEVIISKNSDEFVIGKRCNRLFKLLMIVEGKNSECANIANVSEYELWHKKIGHQNREYVQRFLRHFDINNSINKTDYFCDDCVIGKQTRSVYKRSVTSTSKIGDLIHSDLCGPMEVTSLGVLGILLCLKMIIPNFERSIY